MPKPAAQPGEQRDGKHHPLPNLELLSGALLVQIFGTGLLTPQDAKRCVHLSKRLTQWFLSDEARPVWRRIISDDRLEGETYSDWANQMESWEEYRRELTVAVKSLPRLPIRTTPASPVAAEQQQREALAVRIANFVERVSNAHSWYKHWPVTAGKAQVRFKLDLTARMRDDDGVWVEYVDTDPRFHYTWMTTENYRGRFGYFDYSVHEQDNPRTANISPFVHVSHPRSSPPQQKDVCVPMSYRGPAVAVTSALHGRSDQYELYTGILHEVVSGRLNLEMPSDAIPEEALSWCSRRHFQLGGRLPGEAATDLSCLASALLLGENRDPEEAIVEEAGVEILTRMYPDLEGLISPAKVAQHILDETRRGAGLNCANIAVFAQRCREQMAMGDAMTELCHRTLGKKATPNTSLVRQKIMAKQVRAVSPDNWQEVEE